MKRIVLFLIALCILTAFAGCGENKVGSISSASENLQSGAGVADKFELSQKMLKADDSLKVMMTVSSDTDESGKKFAKLCDFPYDKVNAYFYSYDESGKACEIAVVELKNESDADDLKNSLQKHCGVLEKTASENGKADDAGAAQNAEIIVKGRYVGLIMCGKPKNVKAAFDENIK